MDGFPEKAGNTEYKERCGGKGRWLEMFFGASKMSWR